MLSLKFNTKLYRLQPQAVLAAMVVERVFARHDIVQCVITSGSDGKHRPDSLHYSGYALDFRSKNVPPQLKHEVLEEIRAALGADFDVLLEGLDTPHEHYHVEWDPKGGPHPSEAIV